MEPLSPEYDLAPIPMRAAAFVLDAAIIIVLALMVGSLALSTRASTGVVLPMMIVLTGAYHIGFVAAAGATPGKAALGLLVIHGDEKPRADTAVLRYLVYFAFGAVFPFGTIANIASMFADAERRTFADRIAGTMVLQVRQEE